MGITHTIAMQRQGTGFVHTNAHARIARMAVLPAIISPNASRRTFMRRIFVRSARQSSEHSRRANGPELCIALHALHRSRKRVVNCTAGIRMSHFDLACLHMFSFAGADSSWRRPSSSCHAQHLPAHRPSDQAQGIGSLLHAPWLAKLSCSLHVLFALLALVMAQARPVLLERVLSSSKPLLSIFSFLPISDRQALQSADFYLRADIRWFLLRAPPIADARGAGTSSDSSTSTRLSICMPPISP